MYRIPERAGWNSDTLGWDVVTWISPTRTEWLLANVKSEGCMRSACGQAIVKLDIYQPPASPPASVSLMLQFASPLRATKNRNTSSTTSTIAPLPTPQLRQQNQKQAQQQTRDKGDSSNRTTATATQQEQQQQQQQHQLDTVVMQRKSKAIFGCWQQYSQGPRRPFRNWNWNTRKGFSACHMR